MIYPFSANKLLSNNTQAVTLLQYNISSLYYFVRLAGNASSCALIVKKRGVYCIKGISVISRTVERKYIYDLRKRDVSVKNKL